MKKMLRSVFHRSQLKSLKIYGEHFKEQLDSFKG